jgi:hypothetical protein
MRPGVPRWHTGEWRCRARAITLPGFVCLMPASALIQDVTDIPVLIRRILPLVLCFLLALAFQLLFVPASREHLWLGSPLHGMLLLASASQQAVVLLRRFALPHHPRRFFRSILLIPVVSPVVTVVDITCSAGMTAVVLITTVAFVVIIQLFELVAPVTLVLPVAFVLPATFVFAVVAVIPVAVVVPVAIMPVAVFVLIVVIVVIPVRVLPVPVVGVSIRIAVAIVVDTGRHQNHRNQSRRFSHIAPVTISVNGADYAPSTGQPVGPAEL